MFGEQYLVHRHCFVCRKPLPGIVSEAVEQDFLEPPNDATCWTSRGNYGSTVLDQSPGEATLEIAICDPCLVERKDLTIPFQMLEQRSAQPAKNPLGELNT